MAGQDRERPGPETQRPGLHPPVPKTHTPSTLQAPAEKSQNLRASMATVLDEGAARQVPEPQRHEEGPTPFTQNFAICSNMNELEGHYAKSQAEKHNTV